MLGQLVRVCVGMGVVVMLGCGPSEGAVKNTYVSSTANSGTTSTATATVATTTLSVSASSAPAGGESAIGVSLRVVDGNGVGVAHQSVTWTLNGGSGQLHDAVNTTNEAGLATASVTSTVPGLTHLVVQQGGTQRTQVLSFTQRCTTPSFAAPQLVGIGSLPSQTVGVGDLDADGRLDLVAEAANDTIAVLHNNGTAAFTLRQTLESGPGIDGLVASAIDMDNDGFPDPVDSNWGNASVALFASSSGSSYFPSLAIAAGSDQQPVVGDVDGDGRPDIVGASFYGNHVGIALNRGHDQFTAGPLAPVPDGSWPGWTALADFNGDGRLDILAGSANTTAVSIILNATSDGNVAFAPATSVQAGGPAAEVAAGDVNGDGKADIVAALAPTGAIAVLLGDGSGGFATPAIYHTQADANGPWLADVNGDGLLDIVSGTASGSNVAVLLNQGKGVFGTALLFAAGPTARRMVSGDFNGDGRIDLAVAISGSVAILLNTCN